MKQQSIGIFDSGVGGLSILKAVLAQLPNEHMVYLADSAYAPYGPKGETKIIERSIACTEQLLAKGCKLIIVACNTATTNAIAILRSKYNVPFIGIEPAIKPASLNTKTKAIGILATKGTLNSALFIDKISLYNDEVNIIEQIGEGIVDLIEGGKLNSLEMNELLKRYVDPMISANIDYLVLGCTHYPYLIPQLKKLLPSHVKIIDSGEAVAKQTKTVLEQLSLLNTSSEKGKHYAYTNKDLKILDSFIGDTATVNSLDF